MMATVKHLLFDLKISNHKDEYIVDLVDSPLQLQEAISETLEVPFTETELVERLTELCILKSPQPILPFPRAQREQELRVFGAALYRALFAGQIGAAYRECLGLLRRQDAILLIRLQIEPSELREIPWEYAYGDHLDGSRFLALSPLTPLIRYVDLGKRKDFEADDLTSVLVLAANPTHDWPSLDFAREKASILRNCRKHELEAMGYDQTDRALLQAHLTRHRPTILHFIGHGGDIDGKGVLYLEDASGAARSISVDALWETLRDNRKLRLVVLSACQSARTARQIVSEGLPASIGMQAEISDKASFAFFEAFYTSLLINRSLALAMCDARKAMRLSLGESRSGELAHRLQWGLPVIYMAGKDTEAASDSKARDQETSLVDVALKVRYGLEHLKLSGTPVSIAILPDLVFDFLHEIAFEGLYKRRKMERASKFIRDIGGHAGIAAKTLVTLQDKNEGTYDIQCIIKTGEIGRAVLEEYLVQYAKRRNVLVPDLCHVMTHGHSREQVLGLFGETLVRQQVELDPGRDMCMKDLREHPTQPLESLRTANITGWLTTKSGVFFELMESLKTGELELSGSLFVNASLYSHEKNANDLNRDIFDVLVNTKVGSGSPVDILSLGEKEAIALAAIAFDEEYGEEKAFQAAFALHKRLGMSILYHTWRYVVLFDKGAITAIPTFRIDEPCLHNGAGDTLNAGVMLAMAVRDALALCYRPAPQDLKLSLEECILFGIAVVSCRLANGRYPTQDDLLTFITENCGRLHTKDPLPPEESGDRDVNVIQIVDREIYHDRDQAEMFEGLSSQRSRLERLLAVSKLSQHHQPDVVTALQGLLEDNDEIVVAAAIQALRKMPNHLLLGAEDERRVLLVDLDNTLWNARAARIEASRWSIRRLRREIARLDRDLVYDVALYRQWQICDIADIPDAEIEQLVQFYEAKIYASGIIFEVMGYPNFRRLWNTPESYAVLLGLTHTVERRVGEDFVEKQCILNKIRKARNAISAIDRQDINEEEKHQQIEKIAHELEHDKDIVLLKDLLDQIAMDPLLGDPISRAVEEFEQAPTRPFLDARDFLFSLTKVSSCEICAVTGGPAKEEWERTKRFGLGDLIGPERLLSTQSAARPKKDLENLEQEIQKAEECAKEVQSKKDRLEDKLTLYDGLLKAGVEQELVGEKRETLAKQIQELEDKLSELDQQLAPMIYIHGLFERFLYKRGRPFYARCVHAVHQVPSNPREFLSSFSPTEKVEWEEGIPIKLAIVGDRYDDDLRPLIQIYGDDICSVRILTESYRGRHSNEELDDLGWQKPTYQVGTLAQARNLLVTPSLWNKLVPVSPPPVFEESVNAASVDNLLRAFGMQPDVLSKVTKSVLDENVRDKEKVKNLLEALKLHLQDKKGEPVSKQRAIEVLGIIGAHSAIIAEVYTLLLKQLQYSQDASIRDAALFSLASTLPPEDDRWANVEQCTTVFEWEKLRRLRDRFSHRASEADCLSEK
jgi:hypothetical protein